MPMLIVWKCPICGTQSEPSSGQPEGWFTIATTTSMPEVFDKWECVRAYATEHGTPQ